MQRTSAVFFKFVFLTSIICSATTSQATTAKQVENLLTALQLEKYWDTHVIKNATKSFATTVEKNGTYTTGEILEETKKIQTIFASHFNYKSIEQALISQLVSDLSEDDVDYMTQYSLRMIPESPENNQLFTAKFRSVEIAMRLVSRERIQEMNAQGLFQ